MEFSNSIAKTTEGLSEVIHIRNFIKRTTARRKSICKEQEKRYMPLNIFGIKKITSYFAIMQIKR